LILELSPAFVAKALEPFVLLALVFKGNATPVIEAIKLKAIAIWCR